MTMNKINDGRFSSGSFYLVNEQFRNHNRKGVQLNFMLKLYSHHMAQKLSNVWKAISISRKTFIRAFGQTIPVAGYIITLNIPSKGGGIRCQN